MFQQNNLAKRVEWSVFEKLLQILHAFENQEMCPKIVRKYVGFNKRISKNVLSGHLNVTVL